MANMDTIIDQAKITFGATMDTRVQQETSKLDAYVKKVMVTGKMQSYDGVGTIDLQEVNGRFNDIVYTDFEFWRRWLTRREFYAAIPVDQNDIEERLKDADGSIIDALIMGFNRTKDHVISDAMFADVLTGELAAGTVTYANDGGTTVTATGGLTYEKFLEIKKNFIDNNVMGRKICIGCRGAEHTNMMSELELTSGDFSRQYVVDQGEITRAVGVDVILFAANDANPILPVSGGTCTSFAMAEGAMVLGISRDYDIKVQEVVNKLHTHQIVITGVMAAMRTQGKLIQKVTYTA